MTELIYKYLNTLKKVDGIWAEFGVYKGKTFKKLVRQGIKDNKYVIGIDSFKGMAEATKNDGEYYSQGSLNTNGCIQLKKELAYLSYQRQRHYDLYEGFIPEVLNKINPDWKYSFCYIDLDQYKPTKEVLYFVWDKLNTGGLVLFDDYIERYDILATKAIKEFLNSHTDYIIEEKDIQLIEGGCKSQILIRKI